MFDDPLMAHRPEPNPIEERWHTIGMIRGVVVIVAHTWPQAQDETGFETGRIISVG